MKKNEPCINTTAKLWISHLLVYYFTYITISNLVKNYYLPHWDFFNKESLTIFMLSPIIGITGFLDRFPGFFIFQIILMLVLYYRFFERKIYKSYLVSLLISHLLLYLFLWSINGHKHNFSTSGIESAHIDVLFFVIPSLAVALSVNWFLFGRHENQKKN
ncbi:hypothetical protein FNW52_14340 [Flavobacterium sp. ZT3R18]|uniref:hypothetical protein n=1 Tax=Flavobacterium sp. ZT3R18 TaxID=2594429 RepID=UPI00117AA5DC|nr:hypothetical protein [Flavobacterium sp. ZT3R18]TRX34208.1 hypothetical protein FNW52_14340 [Flavobacterium sp. ZT3R18]